MPVSGGVIAARDEHSRSGATPGYGTVDRTIVGMRDHVYREAIAVGRWVQETQCVAGDGPSDMNADVPDVRSRQPPFMLDTGVGIFGLFARPGDALPASRKRDPTRGLCLVMLPWRRQPKYFNAS